MILMEPNDVASTSRHCMDRQGKLKLPELASDKHYTKFQFFRNDSLATNVHNAVQSNMFSLSLHC